MRHAFLMLAVDGGRQLHALATLPPENKPPIPGVQETRQAKKKQV